MKKIVSFILLLAMLLCASVSSYAYAGNNEEIAPCYEQIATCQSLLDLRGDGLKATVSVSLPQTYKIKVDVQLKYSSTGTNGSWVNYDSKYSFSKVGSYAIGSETFDDVPSGYYYAYATIKIYNNNTGAYIETAYADSSTVHVS